MAPINIHNFIFSLYKIKSHLFSTYTWDRTVNGYFLYLFICGGYSFKVGLINDLVP